VLPVESCHQWNAPTDSPGHCSCRRHPKDSAPDWTPHLYRLQPQRKTFHTQKANLQIYTQKLSQYLRYSIDSQNDLNVLVFGSAFTLKLSTQNFVSVVATFDEVNKVAQVATETSAPFDQRFAFKFKCFLLTGSKSSMPTDYCLPASLSLSLSLSLLLLFAVSLSRMRCPSLCVCKRSFSNFIVSVSGFLTPSRIRERMRRLSF